MLFLIGLVLEMDFRNSDYPRSKFDFKEKAKNRQIIHGYRHQWDFCEGVFVHLKLQFELWKLCKQSLVEINLLSIQLAPSVKLLSC